MLLLLLLLLLQERLRLRRKRIPPAAGQPSRALRAGGRLHAIGLGRRELGHGGAGGERGQGRLGEWHLVAGEQRLLLLLEVLV